MYIACLETNYCTGIDIVIGLHSDTRPSNYDAIFRNAQQDVEVEESRKQQALETSMHTTSLVVYIYLQNSGISYQSHVYTLLQYSPPL
jgi:hypothetical protein